MSGGGSAAADHATTWCEGLHPFGLWPLDARGRMLPEEQYVVRNAVFDKTTGQLRRSSLPWTWQRGTVVGDVAVVRTGPRGRGEGDRGPRNGQGAAAEDVTVMDLAV